MDNLMDARRANLALVIEARGGLRKFCKAYGLNESYWSRILSAKPKKLKGGEIVTEPFTEKAARKIEECVGLAPRSLDAPLDENGNPVLTGPAPLAADAISEVVDKAVAIRRELKLSDEQFATVLKTLFRAP